MFWRIEILSKGNRSKIIYVKYYLLKNSNQTLTINCCINKVFIDVLSYSIEDIHISTKPLCIFAKLLPTAHFNIFSTRGVQTDVFRILLYNYWHIATCDFHANYTLFQLVVWHDLIEALANINLSFSTNLRKVKVLFIHLKIIFVLTHCEFSGYQSWQLAIAWFIFGNNM